MKSCANVKEAKILINLLNALLEIHLTKFVVASKQDILMSLPDRDQAPKNTGRLYPRRSCTKGPRSLLEHRFRPIITVKVSVKKRSITRRRLLSMINQAHDILGLVQPLILPGRKLLQQACRDQTGWDDPLPDKIF